MKIWLLHTLTDKTLFLKTAFFKATNHTKNIIFGAENTNKFLLSRVMLLFDYTKEYAEYICLM